MVFLLKLGVPTIVALLTLVPTILPERWPTFWSQRKYSLAIFTAVVAAALGAWGVEYIPALEEEAARPTVKLTTKPIGTTRYLMRFEKAGDAPVSNLSARVLIPGRITKMEYLGYGKLTTVGQLRSEGGLDPEVQINDALVDLPALSGGSRSIEISIDFTPVPSFIHLGGRDTTTLEYQWNYGGRTLQVETRFHTISGKEVRPGDPVRETTLLNFKSGFTADDMAKLTADVHAWIDGGDHTKSPFGYGVRWQNYPWLREATGK